MKLSAKAILVILLLLNLFVAARGVMDAMIESSKQAVMSTRVPIDWRYRLPRHSETDATQVAPDDSTTSGNSPGCAADVQRQTQGD